MPELGFQDLRSGFRTRDMSPDSVIFNGELNLSIFSSASASVERCSFASDVHDQDSLASEVSQHLAGHDFSESSSGPDPDPNKHKLVLKINDYLNRMHKAKVQKLDSSEAETTEDENLAIDSARNSFSQALKECQDRRSRSEALVKKADRRRPASLDLNNSMINVANSSSPRYGVMKKPSVMTSKTGTFPSPGTPNYRHVSVGIQKGWSSERVPLQTNANRRNVNTMLLPYNSGRTLPSKWEDAERWIFSPMTGDGAVKPSVQQPQRRPKSKSGPLGPPGVAYYQLFSPAAPTNEGGNAGKLVANSPFSAGVMAADGLSIQYGGSRNFPIGTEPCMARSISIHGCSEMLSQSPLPSHEGEIYDGTGDTADSISRAVPRRDMATQMSPESDTHSSPGRKSSFLLATPSIQPILELQTVHSSKPEIRDVPVDERVTVTRWSKKHRSRIPGRGCGNVDDWKRKAVEIRSSSWEVSDLSKSISKIKREDAKITAWENLQKAKAEAAIRKLEMKLEKKRSSSLDKIMNKLRSAQKKAQEMRSSALSNQADPVARTSSKAISFRRTRPIGSLSGCFTCHAF
ncbi:Remorin family protein [Forsythia ovata]|uniref:Remorin family protein n=1 Tax=Forsythia ovata TaxID=205694 RepID=A0ABD1P0M8_9LAMI